MRERLAQAAVLAGGLAVGGLLVRDGFVRLRALERSVTVRGLAERTVDSDTATLELSYVVAGDTLELASARSKEAGNRIESFLKAEAFRPEEVEALSPAFQDQWANVYGSQRAPQRYAARGRFQITTREPEKAKRAAGKAIELAKAGVLLENQNLRYLYTRLNDIKPAMLAEATQNARDAAAAFARDSGAKVGAIRSASQGLFSIQAPLSDWDSGESFQKKVRVVTSVEFQLE